MLVKIKNNRPGSLDLSPLKNHQGAPLILRSKQEYEIMESDLGNPLMQKVMKMGWVELVQAPPVRPAAPAPKPAPRAPARPAEPPVVPAAPAAEVAPAPEPPPAKLKKMPVIKQEAPPEEIKMPDVTKHDDK